MISKKNILIIILFVASSLCHASWRSAEDKYNSGRQNKRDIRGIIIELVSSGYEFSALPWMKEYLINDTKNLDSRIDSALSKIISKTGIKQFETLPINYLKRSKSDNIRYIIAKKYLRQNNYSNATNYLEDINSSHPIAPYAFHMLATIYSIQNKNDQALKIFEKCIDLSEAEMKRNNNVKKLRMNRDYCIVGKARSNFSAKNYDKSDLLYLDIPKSSMIWPEILFEEAWNSYYQKNYNRTLGKLVSYKAPVFQHMFNPEVEVLNALSYLKLCLYSDAKKVSDNFYNDYLNDTRKLRGYINKNKRNDNYFYDEMVGFERNKNVGNKLYNRIYKSISREEAFIDLKKQLIAAAREYDKVKSFKATRFKRAIILNIQDFIQVQRRIIGSYIKNRLISNYAQMYKAFEGMSYIKLEVLAQRKAKLYSFENDNRDRGDIKYIEKNDKQYFWDFNGEFWADELGDYVFALKSEC